MALTSHSPPPAVHAAPKPALDLWADSHDEVANRFPGVAGSPAKAAYSADNPQEDSSPFESRETNPRAWESSMFAGNLDALLNTDALFEDPFESSAGASTGTGDGGLEGSELDAGMRGTSDSSDGSEASSFSGGGSASFGENGSALTLQAGSPDNGGTFLPPVFPTNPVFPAKAANIPGPNLVPPTSPTTPAPQPILSSVWRFGPAGHARLVIQGSLADAAPLQTQISLDFIAKDPVSGNSWLLGSKSVTQINANLVKFTVDFPTDPPPGTWITAKVHGGADAIDWSRGVQLPGAPTCPTIPGKRLSDTVTLPVGNSESITIQSAGHPLDDIQVFHPPGLDAALPMGLIGFAVTNVPIGGRAIVRMILPAGMRASTYYKHDPNSGLLTPFMFDGKSGAEIHGNVITLHLADSGIGKEGSVANGVIIEVGGPGSGPLPPSNIAVVPAATNGEFVTFKSAKPLVNVQAVDSPSTGIVLPLGLFNFTVTNVAIGGRAEVQMFLPSGVNFDGYDKQDPVTGLLSPFKFDGTSGAEIKGKVVTLHLIDGGRGDADGNANGVIVDPGGITVTITSVTPGPEGSGTAINGTESGAIPPWGYTITWGDGATTSLGGGNGTTWGAGHIYTEVGTYTINVTVTDHLGNSGSASTTVSITVDAALTWSQSPQFTNSPGPTPDPPPSLTNPGSQTKAEGNSVSLQITATDSDGDTLAYYATGLPPGLSINSGTGLITGTIDYSAAELYNGTYNSTIWVSDGKGGVANCGFTWTITDTILPPAFSSNSPGNQINAAGDRVSVQVNASDPSSDGFTYSATGLPSGLMIDPTSGLISGTISAAGGSPNPYSVSITADNGTNNTTQTILWQVNPTNRAPQITPPGNQSNARGDNVSLTITSQDIDGDTAVYSATGLPPGLTIDPVSGLISGAISSTANTSSPYMVTVTASDGALSSNKTFSWTISHVGMQNPGSQSNANGDAVSLYVPANDVDGDTLTYSATNLPPGLSINSSSGLISGTIGNSADASSPYSVTVTATDGSNPASQTFTWTVAHLSLANPGNQSTPEGTAVSLQLRGHDSDGDTLTYTATGLPAGLTINTTGLISGTISAGDAAVQPYTVSVTAADASHTAVQTFSWTVTPHVVITNPGTLISAASDRIALPISAVDPDGDVLSFSATGLPSGISISPTTGLISGTLSNTADSGSPYSITVSASDGHGNTNSQNFTWLVSHVLLVNPGNQTNTVGDSASLAIQARDNDGDILSYSASNLPPGLSIDPNTGRISGVIEPGVDSAYPYTVGVTATDGSHPSTLTFTWTIGHMVLVAPANQSGIEGNAVSLQLSAHDSDGDILSYSATGLPTGLRINSGTGLISGTVATGASAGSPYSVTVTASDGNNSVSKGFTWTITPHVTLTNPGTQASATSDVVSLALSGNDSDGDTLTYSATGLPSGLNINSSTGLISGTIGSTADGGSPYSVTVTASDGHGNNTNQVFTWLVSHVFVTNPGVRNNTDGDAVTLQISARDNDHDTLTFTATGLPSGLSISSSGLISGTIASTADTNSPYAVTVTASDGSHNANQSFTWNVNHLSLTNPGNQTSEAAAAVSLALSGRDPDGDVLSYAATGLPPGLTINSSTGVISGTVAPRADGNSPYSVSVYATDGTFIASQKFTWTVTGHPALTNPGSQTNTEGNSVSLQLLASDPDHDTLTYSAVGLPAGLTLNTTTGLISGTVSSGDSATSPYMVTVTASDGSHSTSQLFTWTINPHVLVTNPGLQRNADSDPVSLSISASDPDHDSLTYSASGLPSGLSINSGSGLISGTLSSTADSSSPYHVIVTASDGTYSDSQSFVWLVSHVLIVNPGNQTKHAGDSVSLQLSARDRDNDTLTYSGTGLPPGLSVSTGGLISGTISATAANDSPYKVTVTASDAGHSNSQMFSWTVTQAMVLHSPGNQTNANGDSVSLPLSAVDPDGDHLTFSVTGLPAGLSINASTGIISGTLSTTADSGSPYSTTVTASDGSHNTSQNFTWTVSHIALTNPGNQKNLEGNAVSVQLSAHDSDGDTLTYSATGLPTGLTLNSSGLISGTIAAGQASSSPRTVTVTASDASHSSSQTFLWLIGPHVNLSNPGNRSNADGDAVSLQLSAKDADNDTLTFSATGLPSGLNISSGGLISGTISSTADSGSPYTVTVTASDGTYNKSQTFTWTVAHMAVTNPGAQSNAAGMSVSLQVQGRDIDGDTLSFSATGLPSGLTISSSGLISGTLATTAPSSSPYSVTVTASDGHGKSASQTFPWTVSPHVSLTNPGDQSNLDGDTVSLAIAASDADNEALTYSASNLPPGLTISSTTGLISGTVSGTADLSSPYAVTISAADPGGNSSSQTFNWTVAQHVTLAAPGNFTNRIADTVSVPFTASDQDGDTLTYSAANLPPGLTINASTGVVSGTVSSSASTSTPYSSSVTASDGANSTTQAFTWTIVQHVLVVNPGTQSNKSGATVSLQITANDPDGDPITFSASGLPAGLAINSNTGLISGTITASTGSYTVTVTATDNHSATGSQSFTWNVKTLGLINAGKQVNHDGDTVSLQLITQDSRSGDTLTFYTNGLPPGLGWSSTTGLISGTISSTADTGSPYGVAVSVTGWNGQTSVSDFEFFSWIVNAVSVTSPGDQTNTDGDIVSLPITAGDTDNDPLTFTASGLPPGLTINSSTGVISGMLPSTADAGSPYSVTVTASDGSHSSNSSFNWTIAAKGPSLSPMNDQANFTGDAVSLTTTATDPAGGALTFSATGLPSAVTINPATGLISGTIGTTADSGSPYTVTVTASDGTNSASQTFTWTVSHVNLANLGNQTSAEGATVSLTLGASDADGDTLTYSASGLPPGLSINTSSGIISGTVGNTAHLQSPYLVTVTASDGAHSTSQTFSWTINHVSLTNPTNQTSLEGAVISLQLQGQDADHDALTFNAVGLPAGLSVNSSTGLISGTIAAGDAANRPYTVDASVTDGTNITTQTFTWTVSPYLTVTAPAAQSTPAGSPASLQIQASDTGHLALTYSALGLPPGLTINSSTGLISGTVAAGARIWSYPVTFTASDGTYSSSVNSYWSLMQTNQAPVLTTPGTQSSDEGDAVSLQILAQDPDGDLISYSATGLPQGLDIDPVSGLISGTIGNGIAGSYAVTVTADDGQGGTASQTFTWNVVDPPFTVTGMPVTGVEGTPTGDVVVATISSPNTTLTAGDFTAFVSWGDGSATDQATIRGSGGQLSVVGNHTYALAGNYTISVTATDPDGVSKKGSGTASIADAPVTFVSGVDESNNTFGTQIWLLGGIKDGNKLATASEFAAVVDWGDGTGVTAVNNGSPPYLTFSGVDGDFIVQAPHAYTPFGFYTATVTIYDGDGTILSGTDTIRIVNANTDITTVNAQSIFQDANPSAPTTDFSGTYSWGDGAVTNASFSTTNPPGTGKFAENGSHIYTRKGAYIVTANVTDDDGAQNSISSTQPLYVTHPNITAYGVNIAAKKGVPFNNVEVATFTDPDWIHTAGQFSATIDWGDGGSSSGTVTGAAGLFHVSGSHTYSDGGEYPIMTQIYFADPYLVGIIVGTALVMYMVSSPIMLRNLQFESSQGPAGGPPNAPGMPTRNGYFLNDDVTGQLYGPNQWYDPDLDGKIQPPNEHQWPYAYVRDTKMRVKAVFVPQFRNFVANQLDIRGIVQGPKRKITFQPLNVTRSKNGWFVFEETADTAFDNVATFYNPLTINWSSKAPGQNNWLAAGTSKNPIYLLYNFPIKYFSLVGDLPQTVVDYGSEPGGATAQAVLDSIWSHFNHGNAKRIKDGKPIGYYRNWQCSDARNFLVLISEADGMCGAWTLFMLATILAQGLDTDPFTKILQGVVVNPSKTVIGKKSEKELPDQAFLVKDWAFTHVNGIGLPHPLADYPYTDFYFPTTHDPKRPWIPDFKVPGTLQEYRWPNIHWLEALDWPGVPGQNSRNPQSAFDNHVFVQVNNSLFDPSYGVTYTGIQNMQDSAIDAFYTTSGKELPAPDGTMQFAMFIRQIKAGDDLGLASEGWDPSIIKPGEIPQ